MQWNERIRELREDLYPKKTQTELGKIFNMTQRKISYLETGQENITPDEIKKYCEYFNVSADYLLCFSEVKNCAECTKRNGTQKL